MPAGNERCDELANEAMTKIMRSLKAEQPNQSSQPREATMPNFDKRSGNRRRIRHGEHQTSRSFLLLGFPPLSHFSSEKLLLQFRASNGPSEIGKIIEQ